MFKFIEKRVNKTTSKNASSLYINPNECYIFEKVDDDKCRHVCVKVSENSYTIIDYDKLDEILGLSWHLHKHTGYVNHTITNKTTNLNNCSNIYLHQFIMKHCKHEECPEICTSVDHINQCKLDNRECNLRWSTQSEQNINRGSRDDKKPPPEELQKINIQEYPRHVRYDNSQQRFIIEKHPQLIKHGKTSTNGTRKGSIYEQYYDILKKGQELDNLYYEDEYKQQKLDVFLSFREIAYNFNEYMSKQIFTVPKIRTSSYDFHLEIMDGITNVITKKNQDNKSNHQEKNKIKVVYDGGVIHEESEFKLTKSMIPKHCYFAPGKNGRGDCFKIDKRHPKFNKAPKKQSSSSPTLSIKEKYDEFIKMMNAIENDLPMPEMSSSRKPKKSKYEIDAITQDIENGLSKLEICEKYKVPETIYYQCKSGEKKQTIDHSPEIKQEILHEVMVNKMKLSDASKQYGVSATTIQTWRNTKERTMGEKTEKTTRKKIIIILLDD